MRLQKLKIRGLAPLPQTEWISLGESVTLLKFPEKETGRKVLKAVESLNPRYECSVTQPFKNLSRQTVTTEGHRKLVKPQKRTIVLGIFDSPPDLVRELGAITTYLYEADLIEIGRRLDYSRWLNFVELPSSSRWSELSGDIEKLVETLPGESAPDPHIQQLLQELKPTDRIKGTVAEELTEWLLKLKAGRPESGGLEVVLEQVLRWDHFREARQTLDRVLPLFFPLSLAGDGRLQKLQELTQVSAEAPFPPIILLDCFDPSLPAEPDENVASFVQGLSARFQCLWFARESPPDWIISRIPAIEETVEIGNRTEN